MNAREIEITDGLVTAYAEWLLGLAKRAARGERVSYPRTFGVNDHGQPDDGHVQYRPAFVLQTRQEPPELGDVDDATTVDDCMRAYDLRDDLIEGLERAIENDEITA